MPVVEEAVKARLGAVSGVTSLISTRVYPVKLPQSATLPAVTYQRVSTIRENAMAADPGVARTRLQVTCAADSYSGLKAVTEAVRAALQRYRGTVGGVVVLDVFLDNETDLFGEEENDAGVYLTAQDFIVIHRE